MKARWWTVWALAGAGVLFQCAVMAAAQQDEEPILRPKTPAAKPAAATLLVLCDLACNWKLDGDAKGRIDAGGTAKAKVEFGQHVVIAATEDGADQIQQISEIKARVQTVANMQLKPVRDARLKAEQEARDKADREAKDKADREAREQAAREQKEKQEQRDHAAEPNSQGMTLHSYPADGFSAYFPRDPGMEKSTVPTPDGSTAEQHSYSVEVGNSTLMIVVSDYGASHAGMDPDMVIQRVKKGFLSGSKAHLVSEKKITLGTYNGLEFEAKTQAISFSVRLYFVGTRLYQIVVGSPLGEPYADTKRFLESFQLIDRVRN
jgi:hypothetical protein